MPERYNLSIVIRAQKGVVEGDYLKFIGGSYKQVTYTSGCNPVCRLMLKSWRLGHSCKGRDRWNQWWWHITAGTEDNEVLLGFDFRVILYTRKKL